MKRFLFLSLLAAVPAPAFAQDQVPAANRAAPEEPALCTDRPTKANAPCTVPTGDIQIESDFINWSRTSDAGVRTDILLYTNPTLKIGVTGKSDFELNIAPYETVETRAGGVDPTIGGVGDLFVRYKQRLTSDSSKAQIALIPFVKIPTARLGIGNRKVEGGLAMPVAITVPGGSTLTFGPELDLLFDSNGGGRHLNLVNVVNFSHPLSGKITLIGELWGDQNFDPTGTVSQYSADFALAFALGKRLQLDVGGNFGLNRNSPDVQLYAGISARF
jgi:hypothetical protein